MFEKKMNRIITIIIFAVFIVIMSVNYVSNAEFRELVAFENAPRETQIGIEIPLTEAISKGILNLTKGERIKVDNHYEYIYEGCQYKNPKDGLAKCVVKIVEVIEVTETSCIVNTVEDFTVDIGSCDAYSGEMIFAVYDPNGNIPLR